MTTVCRDHSSKFYNKFSQDVYFHRASSVVHAGVTGAAVLALIAFASNSLLCRLALASGAVDAASFTLIRMWSGALVLMLLSIVTGDSRAHEGGNWSSAITLVVYAITFSFAYVSLSAGVGALLLFGTVQATMIVAARYLGERASWPEWIGLAVALSGLTYLVLPGLTAPSLPGSMLMLVAGVAWGLYTIYGRRSGEPLRTTTGNFARCAPLVVAVVAISWIAASDRVAVSARGVILAAASGGLTSALGYIMWYTALRRLTTVRAAIVQLLVPVLAAAGGIVFLGEQLTSRLIVAAAMILGGVALAVAARQGPGLGPQAPAAGT